MSRIYNCQSLWYLPFDCCWEAPIEEFSLTSNICQESNMSPKCHMHWFDRLSTLIPTFPSSFARISFTTFANTFAWFVKFFSDISPQRSWAQIANNSCLLLSLWILSQFVKEKNTERETLTTRYAAKRTRRSSPYDHLATQSLTKCTTDGEKQKRVIYLTQTKFGLIHCTHFPSNLGWSMSLKNLKKER